MELLRSSGLFLAHFQLVATVAFSGCFQHVAVVKVFLGGVLSVFLACCCG